ncbi:MAG: hypothetical protein OEW16_00735 [Gammaproteobacteria bacterium]|nr:hypothetical protein [Gammaproteobacteria bacterium]
MEQNDIARIIELLERIRDNQMTHLARQAEVLALQKEQFEIVRRQAERAERLQDRAEELQARGMGIMKTARRSIAIVLPVVILLIIYLSWLLFR